jgi:hypothetical protein
MQQQQVCQPMPDRAGFQALLCWVLVLWAVCLLFLAWHT